jgi:tripartite-type tricarboxylate transporter receptor subunit TctC
MTAGVLREPAIVARFAELGAEPGAVTGEAFGRYLKTEADKWAAIVKAAGVAPQ